MRYRGRLQAGRRDRTWRVSCNRLLTIRGYDGLASAKERAMQIEQRHETERLQELLRQLEQERLDRLFGRPCQRPANHVPK